MCILIIPIVVFVIVCIDILFTVHIDGFSWIIAPPLISLVVLSFVIIRSAISIREHERIMWQLREARRWQNQHYEMRRRMNGLDNP